MNMSQIKQYNKEVENPEYSINWKPSFKPTKNYFYLLDKEEKNNFYLTVVKTWYFYNVLYPNIHNAKKYIGTTFECFKKCINLIFFVNKFTFVNINFAGVIKSLKSFITKSNLNFIEINKIKKEIKSSQQTLFCHLTKEQQNEIYQNILDLWFNKTSRNNFTYDIFYNLAHPIFQEKLPLSKKPRMRSIYNKFKFWVNNLNSDNKKKLAIIKTSEFNSNKSIKYDDYSETKYEDDSKTEYDDDSETESESIEIREDFYVSNKRIFEEDLEDLEDYKIIKKKIRTNDYEDKKNFIKSLPFEQFNLIVKKGGFNLCTNQFEKPIDISEEEIDNLGVSGILKLSKMGMINDVI